MLGAGQCFSHGQLYVAFSRVRKECDIKVLIDERRMARNVVLQQILDKEEIKEAEELYAAECAAADNEIVQSPIQSSFLNTSQNLSATPFISNMAQLQPYPTPTIFTTPTTSKRNSILNTPQSQISQPPSSLSSSQSIATSVRSTSQTPRGRGGKDHWGDFRDGQERTRGNLKRKNVEGDGNCLFR